MPRIPLYEMVANNVDSVFSGIICVIAETAGADPWDSFVSDQQIFEAQTIRCNFTKGVSANWDGAEPKLEILRDGPAVVELHDQRNQMIPRKNRGWPTHKISTKLEEKHLEKNICH